MNRTMLFAAFLMLNSVATQAQWTVDSTVNTPVCTAVNLQNNVQIVTDGAGGAVIAWQDQRDAGNTQTDVYAQRVDSAGYAQWQHQGAAMSTAVGLQQQLSIAPDSAGGAAGVWRDQYLGVVAQRILGDGTRGWTPAGIVVASSRNFLGFPQIIRNATGGFIVAWSDDRHANNNIYAQGITDDGTTRWTPEGVRLKPISVSQSQPVIIPRDSSGAIVVWMETGLGIVAQAIDTNGTLPWGNAGRVVCSISGGGEYPNLVSDGTNGAIITWIDRRSGSNGADIYAQHISNTGNALWTSEGNVICNANGDQTNVEIESDGAGGAIIVWEDARQGAPGVYVQRVNAGGVPLWQANGIPVCTLQAAGAINPRVTTDGNGGAFIVWEDARASSRIDIYMQRIDQLGAPQWVGNGRAISTAPRAQTRPALIAGGDGNAIIAWEDARENGIHNDIYAAKTTADGPIPVELALFEATLADGNIVLHWITESETGSFAFSIERSMNGYMWEQIGSVPAAGTSFERVAYTFTDPGPFSPGVAYYRLRQIDTDGSYHFSPHATVSIGNADAFAILSLYPQPVDAVATLRVALPDAMPVRIGIYSMLGKLLRRVHVPPALSAGYHDVAIPAAGLPVGRYIVAVSGPLGVRTAPLLVQR